jgi:hypothetical protein
MPLEPSDLRVDIPAIPLSSVFVPSQESFTGQIGIGLLIGVGAAVIAYLSMIGVLLLLHRWKLSRPGGIGERHPQDTLPMVCNKTEQQVSEPFLQQVSITVWAANSILTRDVVRCLNQLSEVVKTHPFPEVSLDSSIKQAFSGDLQYELSLKPCSDPKECFVAAFSTMQPAQLHAASFPLPHSSPGRYFILKSQGIGFTRPLTLAACIQAAGKRIAEGEINGSNYGFEACYAFQVVPAPYKY